MHAAFFLQLISMAQEVSTQPSFVKLLLWLSKMTVSNFSIYSILQERCSYTL